MSGFIYLWFDRKYKRYYIGAHWGTENDGYICSSPWMKRSYAKRPSDFRRKIIKSDINTRDEMYMLEMNYLSMIKETEIKPHKTNPRYYNLNIKNNNIWHRYDADIKTVGQKISASKKGKPDKRTTSLSEIGKKISIAKKGKPLTEAHRKALAAVPRKPHTEEWKTANSERLKQQWADGTRKSYGPMSEEHKKKIAAGNKGKIRIDVTNYKISHSKKYLITNMNGSTIEVHGLKKYAADNNIPYVTLFKASQKGHSVAKYDIYEVKVL